jgi:uncharacterized membrane protein YfcA
VWAGTINTVVGSGTLVTFPVLLGIGLSPVTANVTNTVGLVPGSVSGTYGYRRELEGQGRHAAILSTASFCGAIAGAVLLLELPAGAFHAIVPVLIVLALLFVVFGGQITDWLAARGRHRSDKVTVPLWLALLGTGVYGGYFGAAQGVLMMGILGMFLADSLQRQNALKNLLSAVTNVVAAAVFVLTSHIDWTAAALVAAGAIVGGLLGARIGRRMSPSVLRATIVVIGIAALVKLLA